MSKVLVSYELNLDGELDARRLQRIEANIVAMLKLGGNDYERLVVKKDRASDFTHGRHDEPMFTTGVDTPAHAVGGYVPTPKKEQDHGTA